MIERVAIRPMVGQPLFSVAVITLGIEVAIRPFNLDATAGIASEPQRAVGCSSWTIGDAFIPKSYVVAMIFAAVAGVAVILFYRSRLGIAMRAVAFDQEAAMAQGINVGRVFAIAWGLGAALAALAAVTYGMAPFPPGGNVEPGDPPGPRLPGAPRSSCSVASTRPPGAVAGGLMIAGAEVFAGEYLSQYNSTLGSGYSTDRPVHRDAHRAARQTVRPVRYTGSPEGLIMSRRTRSHVMTTSRPSGRGY